MLRDLLAHKAFGSGAVALILHRGQVSSVVTLGTTTQDATHPVTESTVFDLASLTKPFVAAMLLTLVEESVLDLDEPVGEHLPSFRAAGRNRVTLRHLLTHTSGLPAILPPGADPLTTALLRPPGADFEYSCVGFIVAGLLVSSVTGEALPALIRQRITDPLGLHNTGFHPTVVPRQRIAATEIQPGRGLVHGEVHDETAWALGGAAGNAGLFGTARDVARFGEMLRRGGTLDGVTVLRPSSVAEMTRDQLSAGIDPGYRHGLGLRLNDSAFMGRLAAATSATATPAAAAGQADHAGQADRAGEGGAGKGGAGKGGGAFGHTGFAGTSLVVDPARELVVVLLTNRVHPSRDRIDLMPLRRAVADVAADYAAARA